MDLFCKDCDYHGWASSLYDRRTHAIQHDEWEHGARLRHLEQFELLQVVGEYKVLLVRPTSNRFARLRTELVARSAIREPLGEGGYDKPTYYAENKYYIVPELCSHALVLAAGNRGVGLLVLECREREAWFPFNEELNRYDKPQLRAHGAAWSIIHLWIHRDHRRRGLGSVLVQLGLYGTGMPAREAGWYAPFTHLGGHLVHRFTPEGFWNAGDPPASLSVCSEPFVGPHRAPGRAGAL